MSKTERAKKAAKIIRAFPEYGEPGADFAVVARLGIVYGRHESVGRWKLTADEAWAYAKGDLAEVSVPNS